MASQIRWAPSSTQMASSYTRDSKAHASWVVKGSIKEELLLEDYFEDIYSESTVLEEEEDQAEESEVPKGTSKDTDSDTTLQKKSHKLLLAVVVVREQNTY